ncbi:MAG: YggU family protein [Deltaproteobacteria bacterium]|nr:YggU family protein [Deltaproteobacteria bacterium]
MWLQEHPQGVTIKVRVTPRSARNVITGEKSGNLRIRLTSPPVEGKANQDLVKFLGKVLRIAPSSISVLRGSTSRDKTLLVTGLDLATARERLRAPSP